MQPVHHYVGQGAGARNNATEGISKWSQQLAVSCCVRPEGVTVHTRLHLPFDRSLLAMLNCSKAPGNGQMLMPQHSPITAASYYWGTWQLLCCHRLQYHQTKLNMCYIACQLCALGHKGRCTSWPMGKSVCFCSICLIACCSCTNETRHAWTDRN